MTRKTLAVTALLMTALLTVTACGGEDDTSPASNAEFNDADVTSATAAITRPASGSAHDQPSVALRTSPTRRTADR